jgi:renalase
MQSQRTQSVVVVGAGISGLACARVVADAGHDVTVLDRGRRPGGRLGQRTVDGHAIDTGASYFTVSDDRFRAVVDHWHARGLAHPWTDTFDVVDDGRFGEPKQGGMRWSGGQGLRALADDLATGLDVRQETALHVTRDGEALLVDGRRAAVVVLAMPDPQARRLLDDTLASAAQLTDDFEPTLALLAGWGERLWEQTHPGFDGAFVNGDDTLTWIADDGRRRGDGAAVLVAHSTVDVARANLDHPDAAAPAMLAALTGILGVDVAPEWSRVQRWSFAHPASSRDRTHHLGDDGVGLCGDSWSDRPRVEAAWLSGTELGDAIVARLAHP